MSNRRDRFLDIYLFYLTLYLWDSTCAPGFQCPLKGRLSCIFSSRCKSVLFPVPISATSVLRPMVTSSMRHSLPFDTSSPVSLSDDVSVRGHTVLIKYYCMHPQPRFQLPLCSLPCRMSMVFTLTISFRYSAWLLLFYTSLSSSIYWSISSLVSCLCSFFLAWWRRPLKWSCRYRCSRAWADRRQCYFINYYYYYYWSLNVLSGGNEKKNSNWHTARNIECPAGSRIRHQLLLGLTSHPPGNPAFWSYRTGKMFFCVRRIVRKKSENHAPKNFAKTNGHAYLYLLVYNYICLIPFQSRKACPVDIPKSSDIRICYSLAYLEDPCLRILPKKFFS